MKTDTEQPYEQGVELKLQVKNVYFFDIDEDGKLRIFREEETES